MAGLVLLLEQTAELVLKVQMEDEQKGLQLLVVVVEVLHQQVVIQSFQQQVEREEMVQQTL